MKRLIVILSLLCIATACDRDHGWNCTRSLGDEIKDTRYPGHFTRLYTYNKVNVNYYYADSCFVEVTYGENIIDQIETSVEGNTLKIANNSTCNLVRNLSIVPEVNVFAPTIEYIENRSAADITTHDTLRAGYFQYQQFKANGNVKLKLRTDTAEIFAHTGYTEITLSGSTYKCALYSAATGKLDASRLSAVNTFVNNASIQDISCVAHNYLYAVVNLSGNIRYSGTPGMVETSINGSGRVIHD